LYESLLYFEGKLKDIAEKYQDIFDKEVGVGFMRGLRAKNSQTVTNILTNSMKEGLIILKAGRNTVRFLPSMTITKDEIDEGFNRFEKALNSI
jgi:acetylornithine aminotransferase